MASSVARQQQSCDTVETDVLGNDVQAHRFLGKARGMVLTSFCLMGTCLLEYWLCDKLSAHANRAVAFPH